MKSALKDVCGVLGEVLGSKVARVFGLMRIAEEEIAADQARNGFTSVDAFPVLYPPPDMLMRADAVYRSHARELVERVRAGEDTRLGTKAEVLLAMSEVSLVAPPSENFAHLMERLFNEVMGPDVFVFDAAQPRESWPGASDDTLGELRRKVAKPKRAIS